MTIRLGDLAVGNLAIGSTPVTALYLGGTSIWLREMTIGNSVGITPTTDSPNVTVPIPASGIGDLLILAWVQRSSTNEVTIPNWNSVVSQVVGGSRLMIYWKFRTAEDGSSVTFTSSSTTQHVATMTAISGASSASPIAGSPSSGTSVQNSSSATTPSINVPVAGAFVFRVAWFGGSAQDVTWPSGVTELAESTPSTAGGSVLSIAYAPQSATGASGTVNASSSSAPRAWATFAIAPQPT